MAASASSMRVVFCSGTVAGSRVDLQKAGMAGKAYWVYGNGGVVLSSSSYASCVGLVLRSNTNPRCGAVAHFWDPTGSKEAGEIFLQYVAKVQAEPGGCGGFVQHEAIVFGGTAMNATSKKFEVDATATAAKITIPRINEICKEIISIAGDTIRLQRVIKVLGSGSDSVFLDLTVSPDQPIEACVKFEFGNLTHYSDVHSPDGYPLLAIKEVRGTLASLSSTRPRRNS